MSASVGSVVIQTIYMNDNRSYKNVQNNINNMGKNVGKTTTAVGGLGKALGGIGAIVAGAFAVTKVVEFGKATSKMAMNVEASTQQINRMMGENSDAFMQWAKTNAIAYNMSKSDAMQYGAVYANLISSFAKDTATTTVYTTDLLKASAVVASSTGRTMEDVMERIRSGMLGNTEAIEDLGINVNIAMIESTNAFKKFANGKSWDQLDFQMQQQIRLFAILEQSAQKYGTEVNQNTNSSMQQLVAQLKNVQLSLGQAFLPIINIVLPILTRFAAKMAEIAELINIISNRFFSTRFGSDETEKSTTALSNQASAVSGLGDSLEETGKQAKKASKQVASFDDLIQIKKPDEEPASGGATTGADMSGMLGALGDSTSALPNALAKFEDFKNKANAFLNGIGINKDTVKNIVGHSKSIAKSMLSIFSELKAPATNLLSTVMSNLGKNIVSALNTGLAIGEGLLGGIDYYLLQNKGRIVSTLTGIMDSAGVFFEQASQLFRGIAGQVEHFFKLETTKQAIADFLAIATDLILKPKELLLMLASDIATGFNSIFTDNTEKFTLFFEGVSQSISNYLSLMKTAIQDTFDTVLKAYEKYAKPAIQNIADGISLLVGKMADAFNKHILPTFNRIVEKFSELYTTAIKPFIQQLAETVGKLILFASQIYKEFVAPVIGFLIDKLAPVFSNVFELIGDVVGTAVRFITSVLGGLLKALGGIIDFLTGVFTGNWSKAWGGIKDIFSGIWQSLVGVMKAPLNLIIDVINSFIRNLNNVLSFDVPDWEILPDSIQGKSYSLSLPQIPKLAKGGVTTGATLAEIGEGKYQEAVLPLNDEVYRKLGKGIADNSQGQQKVENHFHLVVENLIGADESALRDLYRKFKRVAAEEEMRTGGYNYGV